jgi:hypothetical protein
VRAKGIGLLHRSEGLSLGALFAKVITGLYDYAPSTI